GLEEGLTQQPELLPVSSDAVVSFLVRISSDVESGRYGPDTDSDVTSLARWVASLVAKHSRGLVMARDNSGLLAVIQHLRHSSDPTPEHEAQYGGRNMDPPTLAINSVRGQTLLALLALLAADWGDESLPTNGLADGLRE